MVAGIRGECSKKDRHQDRERAGRRERRRRKREVERGNQVEAISVFVNWLETNLCPDSRVENNEATSLEKSVSQVRAGDMGELQQHGHL